MRALNILLFSFFFFNYSSHVANIILNSFSLKHTENKRRKEGCLRGINGICGWERSWKRVFGQEVPTFQVSISLVLEGIYQVQGVFFFFAKEQQECQSSKAIKITLFNRAEWTFPPEQDANALESHFLPSKTSWSHLHMSLGLPGQFFNHQRPADMSLYSPTLLLHDLEKSMPLLYSAPRPPHLPLLPTLPHESKSSSIWRLILGKCHGFSHHWVSMKISL